jgi:hypothetical protein
MLEALNFTYSQAISKVLTVQYVLYLHATRINLKVIHLGCHILHTGA